MELTSIVFMFQLILLVGALPLSVVAWRTSRRHRTLHRTYQAVSMLLGTLVVLGMAMVIIHAIDQEFIDLQSEMMVPVLTLLICAVTIWRSSRIKPRRSSRVTIGGMPSR